MQEADSRILIAGSYGQGNTGDEAILTAIIDQLRTRMPDARLIVVAGDTESVRLQHGVETVWWADWASIAQAIEQCDMVIQGGGGIFFDYTGFHPWNLFENGAPDLAHYGGFSLLAKLYNKPFMIYSVGVGPLLTDDGRKIVRVAHSLADRITVRDDESRSILQEIGVEPKQIEVTADPAFSMRPVVDDRAREILTDHGIDCSRPVIAITARPWGHGVTQAEWGRAVGRDLSRFALTLNAQILLVPFHKGYDDAPLMGIREHLKGNDTFVLQSEHTPQEIAGVIGACDLLLGMRLHSILFAILTGTPAIALCYDPKVRSLARRMGHEEICVEMTELSRLKDLMADVWKRREELSRDFSNACVALKPASERNADLACELLASPVRASGSEYADILARAFYGRLQAVRVRDRMIAKHTETEALREIAEILDEGSSLQPPRPAMPDKEENQSLAEFFDKVVTDSTEHLVAIYDGGPVSKDTIDLVDGFVASGIPTILIGEVERSGVRTTHAESERFLQIAPAALASAWDEVLYAPTERACSRVLLFRSADLNAFRLLNHAHAMKWMTVYYPDRYELSNPEAESYMLSNVEYVIAGSDSGDGKKEAPAQKASLLPEAKSPRDQVDNILRLVSEPIEKSPVHLAIEGATCG